MSELFEEGGPHKIQKVGPDQYQMSVTMPPDSDGMVARECKSLECSPSLFKVKPGTGITNQTKAYCPYCRREAKPGDFTTDAQREYAVRLLKAEAEKGFDKMIRDALDIGPTNKRKLADGLISMELQYTPPTRSPIFPPAGEELRRDVLCPHCTLAHAVYGLAVWCPDCGEDIFVTHVEEEIAVVRRMLTAIPDRLATLGPRVAARDLENALEDAVSIFEGSLKALVRRHLSSRMDRDSVQSEMTKTIGNKFQSVALGAALYQQLTGHDLLVCLNAGKQAELAAAFEKRHPITHNLGVVDKQYLVRAKSGELEGRDIRLQASDVENALGMVLTVIAASHAQLFPKTRAI